MQKTPEKYRQRIEKKIDIEFGNSQTNNIEIGHFRRYYDGMNIGNEISKDNFFKRASIILNNNLGNDLVLIAPLTTKYRKSQKDYYIEVKNYKKYGIKAGNVVLNQIKLIDKKRLIGKMTEIKASIEFVNYLLRKTSLLILGIKK